MMRVVMAPLVAFARVVEQRARRSPHMKRSARRLLAALSRRSREARAFVRMRVMKLV